MWEEPPVNSNGDAPMGQRPPHVKAPAYLTPSPPLPEPDEAAPANEHGGPKGHEPTRYGDWENNGICWDF
jgi:hypothetical protein